MPKTIEELIAEFGPDISWTDKVKLPTADEIRKRAARLFPKKRAAILAELEQIERG